MKKILVSILILGLYIALIGCGDTDTNPIQNEAQDTAISETDQSVLRPKVAVPYNLEIVQNDQEQVDNGHSPWQLDPLQVIMTFVSLQMYPQGIVGEFPIGTEDFEILESNDASAVVEVKNDRTPITKVYLERLVKQDDTGIWTVVGYDFDETRQPSIAGICLWDHKDKVEEVLGSDYTASYYDEAGHFPEPFSIWEYQQGFTITIGQTSNKVLQIVATAPSAQTNLGIKVGDNADGVLKTYRNNYLEATSIHGPELPGVFKVENGQTIIFDFNIEDGLVNPPDQEPEGQVERIILTYPAYLDDSF